MLFDSEILPLPSGPARVQWRRSMQARRVSLRIDPRGGSVVITLPMRAGRAAGMSLLMDHAEWISSRLAELPRHIEIVEQAVIPVDGMPHVIAHVAEGRGGAWIEPGRILVSGAPEFLARRVRDLLRNAARQRFGALAVQKSQGQEKRPRRVSIKDTRTRWGSCTPDGVLMFSWRLIMAPPYVQDYVVAHEVAHLTHMNHSPRFWRLVHALTEHSPAAMAWLQEEGAGLLRIG